MTPIVPTPKAAEPSTLRLAGTMFVAGVLSAIVLVGVNEMTAPLIEQNRKDALERAVLYVLPGSTQAKRLIAGPNGGLVEKEEGEEPAIFAAFDDKGKLVGYAVPGKGIGFADVISLVVGYDPLRKRSTGFTVLESKETPGLGDKIFKFQPFVDAMSDLGIEPEVIAQKPGTSAKTPEPNDVDTISGATISSKAVVKTVNGAFAEWLPRIKQGPSAPAPSGEEE
jgi:Na+-translocating ferredoxin:NAD+ oxidoreductase subunit G